METFLAHDKRRRIAGDGDDGIRDDAVPGRYAYYSGLTCVAEGAQQYVGGYAGKPVWGDSRSSGCVRYEVARGFGDECGLVFRIGAYSGRREHLADGISRWNRDEISFKNYIFFPSA